MKRRDELRIDISSSEQPDMNTILKNTYLFVAVLFLLRRRMLCCKIPAPVHPEFYDLEHFSMGSDQKFVGRSDPLD